MKCPNCLSFAKPDQQYCRSCGANLTGAELRRINPQFWGLSLAFSGILIAMTGKIVDLRLVLFLGVFISIAGMFFTVAYPMLRSVLKRRVPSPPRPDSLQNAPTTKKLAPIGDFEYVPKSVTESTTDLLKEPIRVSKNTES